MKRLLLTTALLALAAPAYAGPTPAPTVTSADGNAIFCGPSAGTKCEVGSDQMVFLEAATGVNLGFGNLGGQTSLPIVDFQSDDGTTLDLTLKNGFATIKPATGFADFTGVDVSVPGFLILGIVWQESLRAVTGVGQIGFSVTANDENPMFKSPVVFGEIASLTDQKDSNNEWSVLALKGTAFTDVNIFSRTGFDDVRQFELLVEPIPTIGGVPELPTWAMGTIGFALFGLGGLYRTRREARYAL